MGTQQALGEVPQAFLAGGPLFTPTAAQVALEAIQRAAIRLYATKARRHRLL